MNNFIEGNDFDDIDKFYIQAKTACLVRFMLRDTLKYVS